jgi:general secretion pathway protein J
METLVMLVLVALAASLMFEILGAYRIARERVFARAGVLDRTELFGQWFRQSVRGLHAAEDTQFEGTDLAWSGLSLAGLKEGPGIPLNVGWKLEISAGDWMVAYSERGERIFTLSLADSTRPGFFYMDGQGRRHDRWPPALGLQVTLPSAVGFTRGDRGDELILASVRGPLAPLPRAFGPEEE